MNSGPTTTQSRGMGAGFQLRTCLENVVGQASDLPLGRLRIFAGETPGHRRPEARATIFQTRPQRFDDGRHEGPTTGCAFDLGNRKQRVAPINRPRPRTLKGTATLWVFCFRAPTMYGPMKPPMFPMAL